MIKFVSFIEVINDLRGLKSHHFTTRWIIIRSIKIIFIIFLNASLIEGDETHLCTKCIFWFLKPPLQIFIDFLFLNLDNFYIGLNRFWVWLWLISRVITKTIIKWSFIYIAECLLYFNIFFIRLFQVINLCHNGIILIKLLLTDIVFAKLGLED